MKTLSSKSRGFTLIELLVVIAIIGILTGIVVTSANPAKQRARDAKRITDLGTIQSAVTLYYDRCKQFPATPLVTTASTGCPSGITLANFISTIPTPPSTPAGGVYRYAVSGSPPNDYVLQATLESYNEILKDDVDGTVISTDCGTQGSSELLYCLSSK